VDNLKYYMKLNFVFYTGHRPLSGYLNIGSCVKFVICEAW